MKCFDLLSITRRYTAAASTALFVAPALAQDAVHPYFEGTKRHSLMAGATWQDAEVKLAATRDRFPETSIDLGDLGLDDDYVSWMAEYRYRINDKWAISLGAFTFEVDGDRSVSREFNFDGTVFEAGAALDTELGVKTYIIDLMYSAYHGERLELMLGGGLHAFDFSAELSARAFIGDQETSTKVAGETILAPLPNLRAQAFYALTPRLSALVTLGWLSAKYDDFDGEFLYAHGRLHYGLGHGIGISAGYQFTDIDLTEDKNNGSNSYQMEFSGPTLLLTYSF